MNYLICDLNIERRGHYIGYNQYILDNISRFEENNPERRYSFLYNGEAKDCLVFPPYIKDRVYFLNDNSWNNSSLKDKTTLLRRVISFAEEKDIDHLLFMDLDQYQLSIFFCKFSFKLSGILFRPHHRIAPSNATFSSRILSWIQRSKKIVAEKLLVYTKQVTNIYILNDEEGVKKLNLFHRTTKFKYLPDPIFTYYLPNVLKSQNEHKVFRFLVFGAINERKNITAILKAYDASTFEINTELVVVGASSNEVYLKHFNEFLKTLTTITPKKALTINASYVSNKEMDNYFAESDACLLIYKDFYGSSGLLGRAALHKKKVIGANVGLLKNLIEQNKLGITCDPNNIKEISESMTKIINIYIEPHFFESFYRKYSPELFMQTLLN